MRHTCCMPWAKVGLTVLVVVMWVAAYFSRHWLTRLNVRFYNLKWSEEFQRKYANRGVLAFGVFILLWIAFLWAVVPE